jgi:outer membrane protein OmpA-like peptidoglycan-associated protein/opacity protein-like surface antigen
MRRDVPRRGGRKTPAARFPLIAALAALLTVAPRAAVALDYSRPGRLYGGVETGVLIPLNAFDRYAGVGGSVAPFLGYKLFMDRNLQPNIGPVVQVQFFGAPQETCTSCSFTGADDNPSYAFAYHAGPRITLPVGPVELFVDWQAGGLSGSNRPSAVTGSKTEWGFTTGGGVNYSLNENLMLGLFGRWDWYNMDVHGMGNLRYSTVGLALTLQQSPPPPPPAPVAQAAPAPAPAPPAKKKIVLRGVNFDFDKYNIRPDAVPILEQACSILKQESSIDVIAKGFTDSIGSDAYNLRLSERRANAVRDWLIKCGISAKRLTAKGFGEADPVASNATAEGRAQNRRTELVVSGE